MGGIVLIDVRDCFVQAVYNFYRHNIIQVLRSPVFFCRIFYQWLIRSQTFDGIGISAHLHIILF